MATGRDQPSRSNGFEPRFITCNLQMREPTESFVTQSGWIRREFQREIVTPVGASPIVVSCAAGQNGRFAEKGASFSVAADGTPPFSYQWQFNGTPIAEPRNQDQLVLTNVNSTQAGGYTPR